ncbi:25320_t:CDS:1, partial [Racocetra persica]
NQTTNIITRSLGIEEDTIMKDSFYDYLEFINHIDLTRIFDIFSIFLKSSDLHTVSNELFVKIVYKSKNLKGITLTVLGLGKLSHKSVIETLKRKPVKLLRILPILFDDDIIESYTTSEIMIRELISECKIDMLWIEEPLNIQSTNIMKLGVNDRSRGVISGFSNLHELTFRDILFDRNFILELRIPQVMIYTQGNFLEFYFTIKENPHVTSFVIEQDIKYSFIKSYIYFKTT